MDQKQNFPPISQTSSIPGNSDGNTSATSLPEEREASTEHASEVGSASEATPASQLLTDHMVAEVLRKDKGHDAKLTSWTTSQLTKKGDNYVCVVSNLTVHFMKDGKASRETYVTKSNPGLQMEFMKVMISDYFQKEIKFYTELLPLLNLELTRNKQSSLRFPTVVATFADRYKEILCMKDLRVEGFKMYDRRKGLDVPHTILALQELGRFHASSHLLQEKTGRRLDEQFPFLADLLNPDDPKRKEQIQKLFSGVLEGGANMVESLGGYTQTVAWIRGLVPDCQKILSELLLSSPQYFTLGHGDCWINNFLFRYDSSGNPLEAVLLDMQLCRYGSPSLDLNFLMYSSFNGPDRSANIDYFLKVYHEAFTEVTEAANVRPLFTVEEVKAEYNDKKLFGLIMCFLTIPFILPDEAQTFDFQEYSRKEEDELFEAQKKKMGHLAKVNPLVKPRLLDMLDEMRNSRVIKY